MGLEISVGLQIVEDGWHEIIPVASSAYLSAISSKIAYFRGTRYWLGILNDEYAKHFSFIYLLSPVFTLSEIGLQLLAYGDAKRMRLVIERIVHALGDVDA